MNTVHPIMHRWSATCTNDFFTKDVRPEMESSDVKFMRLSDIIC